MSTRWTKRFAYTEIHLWRTTPTLERAGSEATLRSLDGHVGTWSRVRSLLRQPRLRSAALAGALGGLAGALTVLLSTVGTGATDGGDGWAAPKLFATPFFDSSALHAGFDRGPVLTGLFVAGLLGAILGAAFGVATHRFKDEFAVPLGALYGLGLYGLAHLLNWPAGSSTWQTTLAAILPAWAVASLFLLYGVVVGVSVMIALSTRDLRPV